jgi:hypothetical protein
MVKTVYIESRIIRYCKYIVLTLFVSNLLIGCKDANKSVRVLFVGDILLSRNVKEELNKRGTSPWSNLKPMFESADLVIGNLEGSVSDLNIQPNVKNEPPIFCIDSNDISLLRDAGFKVISIENNHSNDLGDSGRKNTYKALLDNGITPVSFGNSPQFLNINGLIISIVAINTVIDRGSSQLTIPTIDLEQKLRLAKALSNYVIVTIHWGSELLDWPDKTQRDAANWLTQHGVDLIIGSHPHVIQQPELINGKPVFFSLGNHLFDQKYKPTKQGLIADIEFSNGRVSCNAILTKTQPNSFYPMISKKKHLGFKPTSYNTSQLTVNGIMLYPTSSTDLNNNMISLTGIRNKILWRTKPMKIATINTFQQDNEEFLFMLKTFYSTLDNEINIRPYIYSIDEFGLNAKWRGSALAWPLIDAKIYNEDNCILCAFHRGDSFINLNKKNKDTRIAAYQWDGFGFTGISDSLSIKKCEALFDSNNKKSPNSYPPSTK